MEKQNTIKQPEKEDHNTATAFLQNIHADTNEDTIHPLTPNNVAIHPTYSNIQDTWKHVASSDCEDGLAAYRDCGSATRAM